jgi:hypothetical protein
MEKNFNLDKWPIVYFRTTDKAVNDDSLEEFKKFYLNLLIKCKKEKEKIILICEINLNINIPLKFILKQAKFSKEIYKYNKEYVKCVAIICKDKNFKNILNLFFTFVTPACPYKLCRTFDKANKYFKKFDIDFDTNYFNNNIEIENNIDDIDDNDFELEGYGSNIENIENINNFEEINLNDKNIELPSGVI